MYYNLWNIRKVTSHSFSDCSSDQGTLKAAKWQLGSECPTSYGILKAGIASQILTTTDGTMSSRPKGKEESVSLSTVRQIKKCGVNSNVRLLEERRLTSILTGLEPRILTQAVSFKGEGTGKILNC
jgi:hypothetical protein